MKSLLMTTALTLCLGGAALAQQGQQGGQMDRTGPAASGMQRTVSPDGVSARLISANQLVRKNVVTQDGKRLGRVDYIIVDPATGLVTTLLVRAPALQKQQQGQQAQGGQERGGGRGGAPMVAMPWHAIDINLGDSGEIVAKVPMSTVRQVPTFSDQEIAEVTSPRVIAQLVEYYAPAGQQQAQGQRQQRQQQGQQQGEQQGGDKGMVVGHGVVGMLAPPAVTTVEQMRGLDIALPDGRTVGQVDMVMINADSGIVSYILAKQTPAQTAGQTGGQALAANYVPISFQDLELASDGQSFTLSPDALLIGIVAAPQGQAGMQGDTQRRQAQQQGQMGGQRGYGSDVYGQRQDRQQPGGQQSGGQQSGGQQSGGQGGQASAQIDRAVLGTVASIDRQNRTITLENGSSYRVAGDVDLGQYQPGDPVELRYRVRNNEQRATDIEPAPETALSGRNRPDAGTGPTDGTDSPGNTDDIRRPPRQ